MKFNELRYLDSPGMFSSICVTPRATANHQQKRRSKELRHHRSPETYTSNVFLTTTHCDVT